MRNYQAEIQSAIARVDFGRVTLRREAGVFTIEAEDVTFVRRWGERAMSGE